MQLASTNHIRKESHLTNGCLVGSDATRQYAGKLYRSACMANGICSSRNIHSMAWIIRCSNQMKVVDVAAVHTSDAKIALI